eukprot:TRINITY_DN3722_c0_g1_i2.p1 TRINITY_DN3722_c0_g1~~TRINITY_DN3722_c0_g1_i2.p1  ORF type:complete len:202 (+),score=2.00 TRINITY_DN3722_c0_g1_i2:61-666(+)
MSCSRRVISIARAHLCALGRQIPILNAIQTRSFSKPRQTGALKVSKFAPKAPKPPMKQIMKRFFLMVHPDRFHSHPDIQSVNSASMQRLNDLFTQIKEAANGEGHPPAGFHDLVFFVHRPAADTSAGFHKIALRLRTTGGNCKNTLEKSLGELFFQCGLGREFDWDDLWTMPTLDVIMEQEAEMERQAMEQEERMQRYSPI